MSEARLFVVSYDIASPRRWRRVVKSVKRICRRNQLSVFVCRGTDARMRALEREIRTHLEPTEDRLMIIDLGPAATAAEKLRTVNSISEIIDLGGVVL